MMVSHSLPGAEGCQWPSWPDGEPPPYPPTFCGDPCAVRQDGHRRPYCAEHFAVAYVSAPARREHLAEIHPIATDHAQGLRADGASPAPGEPDDVNNPILPPIGCPPNLAEPDKITAGELRPLTAAEAARHVA